MILENNRKEIISLLKEEFSIYKGNAEIKRSETIQENWIVRWEDYFNAHANPKSLFSEKSFSDIEDAVDFFLKKIGDRFEEE